MMKVAGGITAILLVLGIATTATSTITAAVDPIYISTYGSNWGLWARGHCLLDAWGELGILKIETITLEPNRNYPQFFEITGFQLSVYYVNKITGEPLEGKIANGPRIDYTVSLGPGQEHIVKDLVLKVPDSGLPDRQGVRVLTLNILLGSGTAFEDV